MYAKLVACLILLLPGLPAFAGIIVPPGVHTVGNNAAICDYPTLQAAIDDAASGDTIRVQTINYALPTGITISNKSLTVVGGYSDCNDTTADPDQPTTLTEGGASTVLTVSSVIAGVQNVWLRNFVLRSGDGGANKGGGVDLSGGVTLRLDNVEVRENEAQYGGGIRIHGGPPHPTLRLEGGSLIGGVGPFDMHNNAFQSGGGIYCSDGGVIEWLDASINFNTASQGGGVYLSNCSLTTPAITGGELRTTEIRGNRVLFGGGGLVAQANSTVTLASQLNRQITIVANHADFDGAGVLLNGSFLSADGVHFESNNAGQSGGAIYATNSEATLTRGADDNSNCPSPPRCARLSFNVAGTTGGGISAFNGSNIYLIGVFMEANQASSIAALLSSLGSAVVLRDVQLVRNVAANPGGTRLFHSYDGSLGLRNVTTTGNDVHFVFELENNAMLLARDSIFWEPEAVILSTDGTETLDLSCNNASEDISFPGAATHDPGFRYSLERGPVYPPMRLAGDSANIDRCSELPVVGVVDISGAARLVDVPGIANGAGAQDRGAFEYEPPLFADGFED